jgi:hypothetical protein
MLIYVLLDSFYREKCKTGIDVKYSTGTIEWFDNELPLRDTCTLQSKDFLAMAEIMKKKTRT